MERLACIAIGYVCGLFQTAYILGKIYHIDIRKQGSGNLGSTNVLRTLGKKAGALNLLCDCLKCIVAILIVRAVFADSYGDILPLLSLYAAAGCILGHNFPFYLNFKGGKGFASFLGMSLGIHWKYFIVIGICIILITLITKYIVLATMATVISYPVFIAFDTNNWIIVTMVALLSGIIIIKHYKNLIRIAIGEEFKFKI